MINRVGQTYKKYWPSLVFGPLIKIIEAVFDLMIPLLMKAVIDLQQYQTPENIPNKFSKALATFIRLFGQWGNVREISDALIGGVIILVMGIVGFMITMCSQYIAARVAVRVGRDVRSSLYAHILSFSKKERDNIGTNRLLTVLNSDTYQLQTGVLFFTRLAVRAPFIILGSLLFSFLLDWKIGIAFIIIVPLLIGITGIVLLRARKNYISIQASLDEISSKSTDTVKGARVIRAFNSQEKENEQFETYTKKYQKKAIRVNIINSLINPLTFAVTALVTIIIIFLLRDILLNGSEGERVLISSTIIAEMAYLAQIFFATVQLTTVLIDITKATVSRKRINDILSIQPSIVDGEEETKEIAQNDEIIRFDHVYFSYKENSDHYALSDISFSLLKGQTLGIIGGTGSGKSTIGHLLERFYDVSKGTLFYKSQDIRSYELSSLRSEIGLVNQKSSLFRGTIKSNFLMVNPEITDEEIIQGLKDAEAYEFVSKYEDGINHPVNENGSNFSGGQRQRLCIARGLIKKPELLILDDATSALDLLTEKHIRGNINKLNETTKILISQRVATVSQADLIIVLEGGKPVGLGTHEELLTNCPIYKEIYDSQIKKGNYE